MHKFPPEADLESTRLCSVWAQGQSLHEQQDNRAGVEYLEFALSARPYTFSVKGQGVEWEAITQAISS